MSRRKWSKEARARAKLRRAQKLLSKLSPVPVLAEPEKIEPIGLPAGEARESTHPLPFVERGTLTRSDADSRGGGKSFEYYMTLRSSSVYEFNHLAKLGWEFVGLNNQGWHVFKREL